MPDRSLFAALTQVLTMAAIGAVPLFSHSQDGESAASAKVRGRLTSEGAEANNVSPAEFGRALAIELDSWRAVVKSSGTKL
jgi:hypothetical protein